MPTKFTFDRTVRLLLTIAVIVALFLLCRTLSGVLLPFVVSWFIAYLLHPIVCFMQTKCRLRNRTLAVIVTLILVAVVLVGVIYLLASPVKREVERLIVIIQQYMGGMNAETLLPPEIQERIKEWFSEIDIVTLLSNGELNALITKIMPYITGVIGGTFSILKGLFVAFIGLLYLIFILIDFETISAGFIDIIPPKWRELVQGIMQDLKIGMSKYFRGQALIATLVGILFSIGFVIMGLPMAIIVGLFIGLLNLIPYMQALGIPLCMVLGLLQSAVTGTSYWVILLEIALVFIIVQAIQDLLLTPWIMGKTIGMKPAVILLSLSVWGYLLGIAGMIIALPLTTVIISYYKRFVINKTADSTNKE